MLKCERSETDAFARVLAGQVSDCAVTADGTVYALTRGPGTIVSLDRRGRHLTTLPTPTVGIPHAITIGPDGLLYLADSGAHVIWVHDDAGQLVRTIGTPGEGSPTGVDWGLATVRERYSSIQPGAGPFNRPTMVDFDIEGRMYVSDGYGNARVHRFGQSGEYLSSWGRPGSADGEFRLPHAVLVHGSAIYVADRENDRIQVFDLLGTHLATWTDVQRPAALCLFGDDLAVAELAWTEGEHSFRSGRVSRRREPRVSVLSGAGAVLGRFVDPTGAQLGSPHGIASSIDGDRLYVAQLDGRPVGGVPPVLVLSRA